MFSLYIQNEENKCISKMHIDKPAGVQLKLCATPRLCLNSNISVADCMPLPSLLNTIKINGGVQCTWCMKNLRLSTSIWSITLHGSNVPSTLRRRVRFCRPTTRDTQTPLYHASVLVRLLKMQHILLVMDSPGATAP